VLLQGGAGGMETVPLLKGDPDSSDHSGALVAFGGGHGGGGGGGREMRLRGDKDPTHNSQAVLFRGVALADPEHKFFRFWDKNNARKYNAFLQDLNTKEPAPIAIGVDEVSVLDKDAGDVICHL
jgi:hypothetical protein